MDLTSATEALKRCYRCWIGPETSVSLWHKHCGTSTHWPFWQQLTCTVSGTRTRPSAHTVKAPKKQLNIWGTSGNLAAMSGLQLLSYWTLGYGKPLRAYCSI